MQKIDGANAAIVDTRKTIPELREIEKAILNAKQAAAHILKVDIFIYREALMCLE